MTCVEEAQFWQAIKILIKNFHAVNRKIFGLVITRVEKKENGQFYASTEEELTQCLSHQPNKRTCDGFRIALKLLPKKLTEDILATGIVDFGNLSYACQFSGGALEDFAVRLQNGIILHENKQNPNWLEFVLKPKLLNWSKQSEHVESKVKSLGLIDVEKYNDLYKSLKLKHAQRLLQYWHTSKESTDPLKFIYEDLAIAAYLILLWSQTQTEPTAFADLGCGNGLLVHVLNAEGFTGYGYDIRKRKLWSLYPPETQRNLFEQSVEPNNFRLESGHVDWLIGNHSDELSPWLPVLAARLNASFFLLPCCAYELSGAKFQRRNTSISAYQDFFHYVTTVSQECGFQALQDRLKIPSTKRLALVGLKRPRNNDVTGHELEYFVQEELIRYRTGSVGVKLREKDERVRNCTQVDKSIIDALVLKIFLLLLDAHEDKWSGRLSMEEIARHLTKEELTGIKSECGGIKTLLRNKHEVFDFSAGNFVGIRMPKPSSAKLALATNKKRSCFFKHHHPLSCPLSDAECSFIH
ncbi:hypothetical protein KR018_008013 [Drosophila ironensis]|nr:hypothetical protein KR018_008013 [Drosophila ironensis]